MNLLKSLCVAFSMYSKIPMPKIKWDEKNMKYAMCFFPLVGVVIGVCEMAVFMICRHLGFSDVSRAVIMTAVPVLISGGIHIDGFIDTVDALSSYGNREKKLEILKDPHTGAFAIIGAVIYFLMYFAFMTEIDNSIAVMAVSISFVLSRSLSALAIGIFECAKDSGLLYTFKNTAHKKAIVLVMIFYIMLCIMVIGITGVYGIVVFVGLGLAFLWYRYIAYSKFGGITGDIAGYFVCIGEITSVILGGILCVLL